MYQIKNNIVKASDIAGFLKRKFTGKNVTIKGHSSLNTIKDNSLLFISETINSKFSLKESKNNYFDKLLAEKNILVLCDKNISKYIECSKIISDNVRLDFINVINEFFLEKKKEEFLNEVELKNKFKNVIIYSSVLIGKDVKIGNGTVIMPNVVIMGKVEIGKNCLIKSNTVIGNQGFSFVYDKGKLVHFPHLGSIKIGNNVWIGSNVGIERATFDLTIIEDEVKIDDLVQIGHNSLIKRATQITAGAIICGRVKIGKGCWVAPNSVIENEIEIGNDSFIGTGSVVRRNVEPKTIVAGVPAKFIRKVN